MREFVIQPGTPAKGEVKAKAGGQRAYTAPAVERRATPVPVSPPPPPPAPRTPAVPAAKKKPAAGGQRTYVVSYKGAFVGFFEAQAVLKPREAFLRIAADMAARDETFEPARLELFKPVPIKSARPPEDQNLFRGKLRCVRSKKRR